MLPLNLCHRVPAEYKQFMLLTPEEMRKLIKALHWMLDSCPGELKGYNMQPTPEDCDNCLAPNQTASCSYIRRHGGVTTLYCPKVFSSQEVIR